MDAYGFPTGLQALAVSDRGVRSVTAVGHSIYGPSEIPGFYLGAVDCCRMHVLGVGGGSVNCENGRYGSHPAIRAIVRGLTNLCQATGRVAATDRECARIAFQTLVPGFAFRTPHGLPEVRKYETGTISDVAAFGQGYCHLRAIRPLARARVARILGPNSLVADVLLMLRVFGMHKARVSLRAVAPGLYHLEEKKEEMYVRDLVNEMIGVVKLEPMAQIGSSDPSQDGLRAMQLAMDKGKEHCADCGFMVNPVGHAVRCRVPGAVVRNARLELVGDAIHALDVKLAVVCSNTLDSQLTIVSAKFVSGPAQKEYLQVVDPEAVQGRSIGSWASEFERRYHGEFRAAYLQWLHARLALSDEKRGLVEIRVVAELRDLLVPR